MTPNLSELPAKILIVDNNETNRTVLADQLTHEGYSIDTADHGQQALEKLKTEEYDLLLLDIMILQINGYELLQQLKTNQLWQNLPVMIISGLEEIDTIIKCLEMGAEDYLAKPFNQVILSLRIKSCLEKKRLKKQLQQQEKYSEIFQKEQKLEQFLEALPWGILVIDVTGKTHYTNQQVKRLFGENFDFGISIYQFSQNHQIYLAGTNQFYPSDRLPIVYALQGETFIVDDLEIRKNQTTIPLKMGATPIFNKKQEIIYVVVTFENISEQIQTQAALIQDIDHLLQINQACERFVPNSFLQILNKDDILNIHLGDAIQQEMSVLYAELINFSSLSQKISLEENFKLINTFLSYIEPEIEKQNGFIHQYMGNGIMALFPSSADHALKAGIAILNSLTRYNISRKKQNQSPLQIGIGLHKDSVMLGTIGNENYLKETIISNAINLSSRIEELTKVYGVSLLISHHVFMNLNQLSEYEFRIIDRVKVQGKQEALTVYEVFNADISEIREGKIVTKTMFEEGLLLYHLNSFKAAAQRFSDCLKINPKDRVSQLYLKRSQAYQ